MCSLCDQKMAGMLAGLLIASLFILLHNLKPNENCILNKQVNKYLLIS